MKRKPEKPVVSERRKEIRLEGKKVEGIGVYLIDPNPKPGWDQHERWEGRVLNLSLGGIEVCLGSRFPFSADQKLSVAVRFLDGNEIFLQGVIRHWHHAGHETLVGLQFLWKELSQLDPDLEYRFADQLLLCLRRR